MYKNNRGDEMVPIFLIVVIFFGVLSFLSLTHGG